MNRTFCPFPLQTSYSEDGGGGEGVGLVLSFFLPLVTCFGEDRMGEDTFYCYFPLTYIIKNRDVNHSPVIFLALFLSCRTGVITTLSNPFPRRIPFGEDMGWTLQWPVPFLPDSFLVRKGGYYTVLSLSFLIPFGSSRG